MLMSKRYGRKLAVTLFSLFQEVSLLYFKIDSRTFGCCCATAGTTQIRHTSIVLSFAGQATTAASHLDKRFEPHGSVQPSWIIRTKRHSFWAIPTNPSHGIVMMLYCTLTASLKMRRPVAKALNSTQIPALPQITDSHSFKFFMKQNSDKWKDFNIAINTGSMSLSVISENDS